MRWMLRALSVVLAAAMVASLLGHRRHEKSTAEGLAITYQTRLARTTSIADGPGLIGLILTVWLDLPSWMYVAGLLTSTIGWVFTFRRAARYDESNRR